MEIFHKKLNFNLLKNKLLNILINMSKMYVMFGIKEDVQNMDEFGYICSTLQRNNRRHQNK